MKFPISYPQIPPVGVVSPELGEGDCSGATAVHARRTIARSPGVASLGLGGLSFGGLLTPGAPERSSSLWWLSLVRAWSCPPLLVQL